MTPLKVLLNSYHSGANAWFALAKARGHFAQEGLDVAFVPGSGAYRAPAQLAEQGFDLGFGDMGALVALQGEGREAPVGVYAIHHNSPSAIAVLRVGAVHGPGDLVGRRIITHASDVAYRAFPAYAEAAGIDARSVRVDISELPMADMLRVMLEGGADGVFGYVSSQKAVLRQIDPRLADALRFLPFPAVDRDPYGSVVMAHRRTLQSEPGAVRAFLTALDRSLLEAVLEPEAAVDAVLACNPALLRSVELARWRETIAGEMSHAESLNIGFGAVDELRLGRAIERQARTQSLLHSPRPRALFDDGFLPDVAERIRLAKEVIGS